MSKYSGEASRNATVLWQLLIVVGPSLSLISLVGGSHVLRDTFMEFVGSGYREKLVDYPVFDLRLLKGCLQKCESVIFGSLDPFSMTEFLVVRLKGKHRKCMACRLALRRAVVPWDISMPALVDVISKIVGTWSLLVSYVKETGSKTAGDRLVV